MNEFLFGELDNRHEIVFANDLETAIRYFYSKILSPELYVPDKYIKTDKSGAWVGTYQDHLGFIPEYIPEACIPLSMRAGANWRQVGSLLLSEALRTNRALIAGPRRLSGKP